MLGQCEMQVNSNRVWPIARVEVSRFREIPGASCSSDSYLTARKPSIAVGQIGEDRGSSRATPSGRDGVH
jgi:hypothetical protein